MFNLRKKASGNLICEGVKIFVFRKQIILVTDGGYDGQDNIALVNEKNVRLVTTALIGKEAPDEEGTKLLKCAAGYEPISKAIQSRRVSAGFRLTGIIASAVQIRNSAT